MTEMLAPLAPLYTDLAKAQGEFKAVPRTQTASFTSQKGDDIEYSYAELSDFIDIVRPILSKHGLGFFQRLKKDDGGKWELETVLFHKTGASINAMHPVLQQDNKLLSIMQRLGVAETFARRYALSMITGMASEEDVDETKPAYDENEVDDDIRGIQRRIDSADVKQAKTKNKTARALYEELQQDIDSIDGIASLETFGQYRATDIASLPADWQEDILKRYKDMKIKIKINAPDDARPDQGELLENEKGEKDGEKR